MIYSNSNKTNCQVKEAWGDFLSKKFKWDLFVTLTFKDSVFYTDKKSGKVNSYPITNKIANIRFAEFMRTMRRRQKHRSEFIRVTEFGKWNRAKPHYHCLIGNAADIYRMGMVDWWWGKGYGIARVEKYDKSKGAGYYLGKYLLKSNSEVLLSRGINKLATDNS